MQKAIRATAEHRSTELLPLSAALGDLVDARADLYARYRRNQGSDGEHLPESFDRLVTDVISFADPLLTGTAGPRTRWQSSTRSWTG